jgi:hypothetical protein
MKWIIIAIALAAAAQSHAGVYTWIDANGIVQYSDTPPASVQAQALDIDTTAPTSTGTNLRPGELEMLKDFENRMIDKRATAQRTRTLAKTHTRDGASESRCAHFRAWERKARAQQRDGVSARDSQKLEDWRRNMTAKRREHCQ